MVRMANVQTMGQGTSKRNLWSKDEGTNILLTGLYNAGKTTLVQKLTPDGPEFVCPMYYVVEKGKHKNLIFTTWDLGGRCSERPLLRRYFHVFDAIIHVVDSSERIYFEQGDMKAVLQSVLWEEEMKKVPILILANKQDLPGAVTCQQVAEELGLSQISSDRSVEILPLSLETDEGLPELREWLERQERAKLLRETVIKPLEKAVPPTVKSSCSKMSSALKQAFGMVKSKLSPSS